MWKEFSRLILVCSLAKKNASDYTFGFAELDNSGVDVSNTVIAVMDPEDCPKSLTYSSVFRMYPPWEILYLQDLDRVILLRPKKLEIISNDDAHLYRDFNLKSNPSVLQTKCYCSCADACDCNLPEGYLTVIKPLMSTDIDSCSSKRYLKYYNAECFKSSCITDLVLKHRLYANDRLSVDLRVIHAHNVQSNEFWYLVCEDEKRDVCCVVVEGRKMNSTIVDKTTLLRFIGIEPWKWIPAESVRSFAEFVKLVDVSRTGITMGANRLCVFVMFEQSARIERLDSTPQR